VPHALATLAFDGRRGVYFRKELLNALRILEDGHIAPDKMKGSWAGAMGQSQFMPSSFLSYAVDWDSMANVIYGALSPMCLPQPLITCRKQAGAMTLPGDGK